MYNHAKEAKVLMNNMVGMPMDKLFDVALKNAQNISTIGKDSELILKSLSNVIDDLISIANYYRYEWYEEGNDIDITDEVYTLLYALEGISVVDKCLANDLEVLNEAAKYSIVA